MHPNDVGPTPAQRWREGWWAGARAVPSPNEGPRPPGVVPELVVIHSISLPPGRYGGAEIEDFFTNRLDCSQHPYFERLRGLEVSAHFVVRRDGELLQFVSCDRRAWHAGRSVFRGRENCNDFSVGIELEGLEGEAFAPVQYRALVLLLRELRAVYPIAHVAGHEHVAPGRKADPGAAFDWQGLQRALDWPVACFAPLAAASA
ncbi:MULTISPECIES: 1,6-anhydro-N-acetylmuramyl-L-alanine amidase AmpD [Caldimonas]|jgi:AmpD protein|uniref:1,6-anhydro-N-acetylmuramyl-L-alanine amidase AmpD n=1 Tax=Caldimonas TaxID=196013 RepID=UPI0003678011|nr:1,6-anhydro-N-acetylmuramyl-L-alanine amidase AmpD [Caldimonas manganoxidans]MCX7659250.1 1,6-anhydro-N-acetylmuramyl-L-alanine amidase AmpD [Caldimonas manganoxidans]